MSLTSKNVSTVVVSALVVGVGLSGTTLANDIYANFPVTTKGVIAC